jgi:hypothetical protein
MDVKLCQCNKDFINDNISEFADFLWELTQNNREVFLCMQMAYGDTIAKMRGIVPHTNEKYLAVSRLARLKWTIQSTGVQCPLRLRYVVKLILANCNGPLVLDLFSTYSPDDWLDSLKFIGSKVDLHQ